MMTTRAHVKGWAAYKAEDFAAALKEFRPLAESGDAISQYLLGLMYGFGSGVPKDNKEAFKWHMKAAKQGYAGAQTDLGHFYLNGKSVPQDYILSHMWYNIAATNGSEQGVLSRDYWGTYKMTPAAVAKAQAMAGKCMSSGYTKCGY